MAVTKKFDKRRVGAVPFLMLLILLLGASVAHACTAYVGTLSVRGNHSTTAWATATGTDLWGGAQSMTQTVSSGVAVAKQAAGQFWIQTDDANPGVSNRYLRADSNRYDVNFQNGTGTSSYGYKNHTTWNDPGGDCMTWTLDGNTIRVGKVDMKANTSANRGEIAAAFGPDGVTTVPVGTVAGLDNVAGPFNMPASVIVPPSPYEQAVCVSDSKSIHGNQAPLKIVTV